MNATNPTTVTPDRLMQLAWAYAPPLILEAAIRNRVFDELDAGPKTVAELHAATGASVRGVAAIANVLVGLDFLSKDDAGRYSLTPESAAFLVRSKPSFMGGLLLHTSEQLVPRWLKLREIVETGKPAVAANQEDSGSIFFEQFVLDILPMSFPSARSLAEHFQLSGATKPVSVLDLAAGSGVWGIALAQTSPHVHVTAVDWPGVLPVTEKTVAKFGFSDRFKFAAGDLLEADFGSRHHIATLGHILHSEGAERSRALLAKTFAALAPGGTIAIAEFLVNKDRSGPMNGLIFAVNMLVNTDDGGTYSFEEISEWLKEAGFVNPRTIDSPGPSPLILATKP
jgi:3-hydroxy-5-methyl-1-naphthoate 3-O-methyltransferase